ncbi:MAG: phosphotransferase [Acidimicrobiales bacterium]
MADRALWLTERRDDWLTRVRRWAQEELASSGERLMSIEPVKERPWGAVLRVRSSSRVLYLKAVGPRGRHELRLLADVDSLGAGLGPELVAVDHDRGWMLLADHGAPAVDVMDPADEVVVTEELLPRYAALQRGSARLVPDWIEAGVPDRSPGRLPHLVGELLDGRGAMGPLPLDPTDAAAYRGILPDLERACDVLARSATPTAIDHADIHGTNVLVGAGGSRLIDWGDACISHPFTSLLVPIEWVAAKLPVDEQADAVHRLRDAYLGPWGDAGDTTVAGIAVWVGYASRALSNDEQCAGGAPEHVRDGQREIAALLRAWHVKRADLDRPERLLDPVLEL